MGKISEIINSMFKRSLESSEFTSASPGHINTLIAINDVDEPDFEAEIESLIKENQEKLSKNPDNPIVTGKL